MTYLSLTTQNFHIIMIFSIIFIIAIVTTIIILSNSEAVKIYNILSRLCFKGCTMQSI